MLTAILEEATFYPHFTDWEMAWCKYLQGSYTQEGEPVFITITHPGFDVTAPPNTYPASPKHH